ncbi:MAG: PadR family transcriptional regulator [Candidatus Heimdallarchaeota archaeon]|nr:PadR family transcriptional regulator [Candidatus Heimdallarchaeota archaeon]
MSEEFIEDLVLKWATEYKKGFAKPLILYFLSVEKNYPYQLTQDIYHETNAEINIAGSNIYPLLAGLKHDGIVSSERIIVEESNKLRTEYSLTFLGQKLLQGLRVELLNFLKIMQNILEETPQINQDIW